MKFNIIIEKRISGTIVEELMATLAEIMEPGLRLISVSQLRNREGKCQIIQN